jgi:hypothetical protein
MAEDKVPAYLKDLGLDKGSEEKFKEITTEDLYNLAEATLKKRKKGGGYGGLCCCCCSSS